MNRFWAFLSLFTSVGTLVCCALPALFVVLGFGAAFAGIVGTFPQLIWLSEHKEWIFGFGAVMLSVGGYLQWKSRVESCPIDPDTGRACSDARNWSKAIYFLSVGLYLLGLFFAFVAPLIL